MLPDDREMAGSRVVRAAADLDSLQENDFQRAGVEGLGVHDVEIDGADFDLGARLPDEIVPNISGCNVRMKTPTRHSGRPASTRRSQHSAIITLASGADRAPSISQSISFWNFAVFIFTASAGSSLSVKPTSGLCVWLMSGQSRANRNGRKMLEFRAWKRQVNGLRERLEAADPATLLLALVQISGERHWLEQAKPFIRGPMSYQETMPEPLRAQIRDRLAQVLTAHAGKPAAAGR